MLLMLVTYFVQYKDVAGKVEVFYETETKVVIETSRC
jgi:hypothetical protein